LRKALLAFGFFLVFISLTFASSSKLQVESKGWSEAQSVIDQWEIASQFHKGDNITLDIRWLLPVEYTELTAFNGTVTFIAPSQGETKFRVLFTLITNPPQDFLQPGQEQFPLQVTKIELITLYSDSFVISNPPREIGGIALQDGMYTARIDKEELWWLTIPPKMLKFLKEVVDKQHPYDFLLPFGVVSGALGVVCVVFSTRSVKKHRTSKTKSKLKRKT